MTRDLFGDDEAIEVLAVHPLHDAGPLRAYVSIRLGPLTIHGCRVIMEDGKRAWASLPQVPNGARWLSLIRVSDDRLHDRIREAILAAWREQTGEPAA